MKRIAVIKIISKIRMSIFEIIRTIVYNTFPKPLLYTIFKLQKKKLVDFSVINLIREKGLAYLSNPSLLESDLLLKLGLNNERMDLFPEELYPFFGYGLFYWQYPNQLSKYLVKLSKLKIGSYLEIGVRHGGTFVLTVEYLNKFHPIIEAVAVDISRCPSLIKYKEINQKVNFIQVDSRSDKFLEFIVNHGGFDLVLIDGDHYGCMTDFEIVREKANIIALHDMASDAWPSVIEAWKTIKATYADVFEFFEYTDQYESVYKRTGQVCVGIGLAVKKKYLQEIGIKNTSEE